MVALQEIQDSGGEPHFFVKSGTWVFGLSSHLWWIVESRVLEKIASILGFIDIHLHIIGVTNG